MTERHRRWWTAGLAAVLWASSWLVMANAVAVVHAQEAPPTTWEPAINLSNTPTQSEAPAIVADASGMVHVFWSETVDESTNYSNAIFYTRWDGTSWSPPRDVVLSPEGLTAMASVPTVTLGRDGRLHLLFSGGWNGKLYYTSARADEALSARAWIRPVPLSLGNGGTAGHAIVADAEGTLHAIYVVDGGIDQGVYYLHSKDDGATWSSPTRIPGSRMGSAYMIGDPALAISQEGTLHVMWFWTTVREFFPPKGLIYARSDDRGHTWSDPAHFADGPFRDPTLATRNANEIYVVWNGTMDQRYKLYRWSTDSGRSWSSTAHIPDLGGFQGTAGMAVDSSGTLHLALVGGHPIYGDSLYHYQWNGEGWTGPDVLMKDPRLPGSNMGEGRIAISEGNLLHVLTTAPVLTGDDQKFDIFYVRGEARARHVEPVPLPNLTQSPTSEPKTLQDALPTGNTAIPTATATTAISSDVARTSTPDPASGGIEVFTTGMVAVLVALSVVTGIQVARRDRSRWR